MGLEDRLARLEKDYIDEDDRYLFDEWFLLCVSEGTFKIPYQTHGKLTLEQRIVCLDESAGRLKADNYFERYAEEINRLRERLLEKIQRGGFYGEY